VACLALCLTLCLAPALAGCSGGGNSPNSSRTAPTAQPSTGPAAVAAVKAMWQRFFNGAVPIPARLALLQDSKQIAPFVRAQEQTAIMTFVLQATATVSSVKLGPPGQASLIFTVLLGGKPLAKNLHGNAVYAGGRWLVAASSFCTLMRQAYGKHHPVFPAICAG
jgi:hypothetical protein